MRSLLVVGGAGVLGRSSLPVLALQRVSLFHLAPPALSVCVTETWVDVTCGWSPSPVRVRRVLWLTCPRFSFRWYLPESPLKPACLLLPPPPHLPLVRCVSTEMCDQPTSPRGRLRPSVCMGVYLTRGPLLPECTGSFFRGDPCPAFGGDLLFLGHLSLPGPHRMLGKGRKLSTDVAVSFPLSDSPCFFHFARFLTLTMNRAFFPSCFLSDFIGLAKSQWQTISFFFFKNFIVVDLYDMKPPYLVVEILKSHKGVQEIPFQEACITLFF